MNTIQLLESDQASIETQELYAALKNQLGTVPNVYKVYGHSSAALKANLLLDETLSKGQLTGKEIEVVALTVSEFNACEYCIAAHTVVGKMHGLTESDTEDVRRGRIENKKYQALIDFSLAVLEAKGKVDEKKIEDFYAAGYDEGSIVEVIGQIAKNVFNNYTNHLASTPIDFPKPNAL